MRPKKSFYIEKKAEFYYDYVMSFDFPAWFYDFVQPDAHRAAIIQKCLNDEGLDCPVLQIEGKNHLYVKFPLSQYNSGYKIKTVIAHYDRFPGCPGANDNSAAILCILEWIHRLVRMRDFHNVRILFTDGEEQGENSIREQGAFALAQVFRRLGIVNDSIFVFDCVGRGDVPVICQPKFPKKISSSFLKRYNALEADVEKVLRPAGKFLKLPSSYSDNASFLVNGIPAVTITMLPSEEADAYQRSLLNPGMPTKIPLTWQLFHTKKDDIDSLTKESFSVMEVILDYLATFKTVC